VVRVIPAPQRNRQITKIGREQTKWFDAKKPGEEREHARRPNHPKGGLGKRRGAVGRWKGFEKNKLPKKAFWIQKKMEKKHEGEPLLRVKNRVTHCTRVADQPAKSRKKSLVQKERQANSFRNKVRRPYQREARDSSKLISLL